jgi:hypothetical protein
VNLLANASSEEVFGILRMCPYFRHRVLTALAGGAAGLWVTGLLHDLFGNYALAFAIGIAVRGVSAVAIWLASPRKIRAVAGQLPGRESVAGTWR